MEKHFDLSQQICFSYYSVNRLFNKFYQQALEPFGLTYTQYIALMALWEESSLPLNELGQKLGLASNTLTPLVKRLEDRGLLLRLRPEKDKRQLIVQLTKEGQSIHEKVEQQLMNCFVALNGFTPESAAVILQANHQLINSLTQYLEPEGDPQ